MSRHGETQQWKQEKKYINDIIVSFVFDICTFSIYNIPPKETAIKSLTIVRGSDFTCRAANAAGPRARDDATLPMSVWTAGTTRKRLFFFVIRIKNNSRDPRNVYRKLTLARHFSDTKSFIGISNVHFGFLR